MKKIIGYTILVGIIVLLVAMYTIMYGFLVTLICAGLIILFVWLTVTAINLIS